jgi:hypothetical protein
MRRRYVVIALAVIAALAIGFASASGKSKSKRGPAGPPGPQGVPGATGATGATGAPGTARAYARVHSNTNAACAPNCTIDHSLGVSTVTHPGVGDYCVNVPGADAHTVSAAVSLDFGQTANPEGNASAFAFTNCSGNGFEVRTERLSVTGATDAVPADDVGFTIVIP